MKHYRLKKDTPECKEGTIFQYCDKHRIPGYHTVDQDEESDYLLFYPKDKVENNPEWFEEVKEKGFEILSYIAKNGTHVTKKKRGGDTHENYWKIFSIKRLKDNEVFTIGDLYTPRFDHSVKRVVDEIQLVKDSVSLYCGGFGRTLLNEAYKITKEQIGTTVKGEPIYKGDKVYWIKSDYSIAKSNSLNAIEGDFQCFFSLTDATQWIVHNTYVTHDNIRVKNGTIIYGIAIQASGRDKWREQVLPFPKTESSHRKWFSSKANALEYLINNTPLFTINDIFNSSIRKKTHPLHDYHTATQTVIDYLRKNNIPC